MIVVFGGAFNPVTNAHIKVYEYLTDKFVKAEFVFLPVSSAYTKSDLVSDYHRVNMLEIALKEKENASVNHIEITDSNFLGTYQSLIRIADRYADDVCFVVGADNLQGMEEWINIEGILADFKIIVLGRNKINSKKLILGNEILNRFLNSFIIFEDFDVDISSTGFRESFEKNLVPEEVYKYIMENELYRGDDNV